MLWAMRLAIECGGFGCCSMLWIDSLLVWCCDWENIRSLSYGCLELIREGTLCLYVVLYAWSFFWLE